MRPKIPFDYSSWIWCNQYPKSDEYGEFYDSFHYTGEHGVTAYISADSNYAIYVNGRLASFGQYADYPHDKVFDEVDLTDYCKRGTNHLAIVVWYYGLKSSSTYYLGNASLRFAVWEGDKCICISTQKTMSRQSHAYRQHANKIITGQMGLSFAYDATAEDGWMMGEGKEMTESVLVAQAPALRPRPCAKLVLERPTTAKEIKRFADGTILYDLGREEVGFLSLDIVCTKAQNLIISYGEHIVDGRVRRLIGKRDFSVEYFAREGRNIYMNPFRRLACRYLEITPKDQQSIRVDRITIVPTMYPTKPATMPSSLTAVQKTIYDACVRTLRLCMHEHYEDCPWREQSLYTMDSRNQMLCGYYAFGEYRFARANLELISKDARPDGLLSICYPSSYDLVIPSFSLHYVTEVYEYLKYSGDRRFVYKIFPKMQSVIRVFLDRIQNGLVAQFPEHWNFYEWKTGLHGHLGKKDSPRENEPHLVLNCLLLYALQNMAKIAGSISEHGAEEQYLKDADALSKQIYNAFYDPKAGLFRNYADQADYSQLGNSLAILCEVVKGEDAAALAKKLIADASIVPTSLSMKCFFYDALLKVSPTYRNFILSDIEKIYLPMLSGGTGTVWETEDGEADFSLAGSLCHGWSAMPVYYYHLLCK